MTPLEIALEHAARGFRVLPLFEITPHGTCACSAGAECKSSGKHPALIDWPNRATTDPDTIREWWGKRPNRNIGIACGMESGVFVLDIDVAKGGDDTRRELEASYGKLPDTWECLTPTGGSHLFFKAVPNLPNSTGDHNSLGAGLDIRGEGGQVVAAGSRRAGGTYQWELSSHPDDIELAEAPDWLLGLIFKSGPASRRGTGPVVRDAPADWEKVKAGCPALAYATGEGQDKQGRPSWRHVVLNVVSFCEDPVRVAHEVSRNHPQYSHAETETEIRDALAKTRSPARCSTIETAYKFNEFCQKCPHYKTRLGSPVTLGKPKIEVFQAGTRGRPVLPEGVERWPEYPCYSEMSDPDKKFNIKDKDQESVLFSIASQDRGQDHSPHIAKLNLLSVNERRCSGKRVEENIDLIISKVYSSKTVLAAGCDVLQKANLCPAKHGTVVCPIYQIEEKKRASETKAISNDEARLTISPMWVLRTDPPVYTVTYKGQKIQISHEQLFEWRLFQKKAMITQGIDEIPRIHHVPVESTDIRGNVKVTNLPSQQVWIGVVNEALASAIELPLPPEDASEAGVIWDSVREFISNQQLGEDKDCLIGNSILSEDGFYYFRGSHLRAWLKRNSMEPKDTTKLYLVIRDHGGDNKTVRTTKKPVKVWFVPTKSVELEMIDEGEGSGSALIGAQA